MGKKFDLKGCNFKPMRGLDMLTVKDILQRITEEKLTLTEMARECKKRKTLRDLQKAFIAETGMKMWEEAEERFPYYANAEALDQCRTM